ncbi:MAG: hypothetical protein ACOX0W_00110 [Sphaerochaetaceae bacterium]
MSTVRSGFSWYGQKVGVLVFGGVAPRIEGDPGHAGSFQYPVRYATVEGKFLDLVEGSDRIKQNLIQAIEQLKEEGVEAVVGDCGLMSLYQHQLGSITQLPIAASSLSLIPLVWNFIGRKGSIGIITGHSELLKDTHLEHSGRSSEMHLSIQGMEDEPHFTEIVINGGTDLDPFAMEKDVISAVNKLIDKTENLRAIILECSNLATFSRSAYESSRLPVFDIMAAANLIAYSVDPPCYLRR